MVILFLLCAHGCRYSRYCQKCEYNLIHKTHHYYFNLSYCSSVTGSSHSLKAFSPGISKARCANQLSAAPCQCFYVGGNMNDRAGQNLLCWVLLLLIPTATGHADKHLAVFRSFMDVPVVAGIRLWHRCRSYLQPRRPWRDRMSPMLWVNPHKNRGG